MHFFLLSDVLIFRDTDGNDPGRDTFTFSLSDQRRCSLRCSVDVTFPVSQRRRSNGIRAYCFLLGHYLPFRYFQSERETFCLDCELQKFSRKNLQVVIARNLYNLQHFE